MNRISKKILVIIGLTLMSKSIHADLICNVYLQGGVDTLHWQAQYLLDQELIENEHQEKIDLSPFHITKDFQKNVWKISLAVELADKNLRHISTLNFKENSDDRFVMQPLILRSGNYELHFSCSTNLAQSHGIIETEEITIARRGGLFRKLLARIFF